MSRRITDREREAILDARAEGLTRDAIQRKLGIPYQSVARVLRLAFAAGDARARSVPGERGTRTEEVLNLRASGLGEAEIAARLRMNPGSVACMVWRARQAGDARAAKLPRAEIRARRARLRAERNGIAMGGDGTPMVKAEGAGPQRPAPDAAASASASASRLRPQHASLTVAGGEHAAEVVRGVGQSVRGPARSVRGQGLRAEAADGG